MVTAHGDFVFCYNRLRFLLQPASFFATAEVGERGDRGRRGRAALLQATFGEDGRRGFVLHATTGIENCYHHRPIQLQPPSQFAASHNDTFFFAGSDAQICWNGASKMLQR